MYQFCSGACGYGLMSETRAMWIAFGYCYSVMALGGSPPKIGFKCLLLFRSRCKMMFSKSGLFRLSGPDGIRAHIQTVK